ncbi:MAG: Rv0909 family putative TA system antitoxin [Micrococcales bacterium]|nr:Rv0909 family putative TA system antitoxin [Micrococcales bacterium]
MVDFGGIADKAKGAVGSHGDKVAGAVGKAGEVVKDKTSLPDDKVDAVVEKVETLLTDKKKK